MACFVECHGAGAFPVESGRVEWSESLASAGTSSNAVDGSGLFITATSDENGYIAFAVTPNSAANPRHRLIAGMSRSFYVDDGWKAMYTAG